LAQASFWLICILWNPNGGILRQREMGAAAILQWCLWPIGLAFMGHLVQGLDIRSKARQLEISSKSKQPAITYESLPNIPNEDQQLQSAFEATNEAAWAASEANSAAAQARGAEAQEVAAQNELESVSKALETKIVVQRATKEAERSIENMHISETQATSSRKMEDEIAPAAMAAAKRAVKDVVNKAIADLNAEAGATRDQALAQRKVAAINSAKESQKAALPFEQARLRNQKSSLEWVIKAHRLASTVTELKTEAMRIGGTAGAYQSAGLGIIAQNMLNKAHDMMNKAIQLEGMAKGAAGNAAAARGAAGKPAADAIGAAKAYGAYLGNPAGERPAFPPLPKPLKLPPVKK